MKKILLFIFLLVAVHAVAQDAIPDNAYWDSKKQVWRLPDGTILGDNQVNAPRSSSFRWNKAFAIGLGYSHYYSAMKGDDYVSMMPKDLVGVDITLYGVYLGCDIMSKKTGYKVYGYDEKVTVMDVKLGGSVFIGKGRDGFVVTPYIGYAWCTVDDDSHNSIGARTSYDKHADTFFFGSRFAYRYKAGEYGVHVSTKEFGVNIALNLSTQ